MLPKTRTVHPERALLTPTWLGALALLVANDHWLKGAGMIPGSLTGKLSDFAGMLVAPTLLAALLRVRTTRGLAACHLAVAGVFAGIQLSSGFAAQWSAAMGLLGHPWTITCDPTDLLALPFLWISWRLLTPAMDPERPALVGLQRSAVAAASVFGLWATVATSDDGGSYDGGCGWCDGTDGGTDGGNDDGGGWEEVRGRVYIHNPNDFPISLHIRLLRSDVELDCGAIAGDPGRLLADEAFGAAEHWELPPTTNVAVDTLHTCLAAKVAGEGIPEQILFSTNVTDSRWFPGSHPALAELWNRGTAIRMDEGSVSWIGGEEWRYTPKSGSVPQPEECMPEPGERHLDWSAISSSTAIEIVSLAAGLDGCHEIDLLRWTGPETNQALTWYLCAPESSIRFELGEFYRIGSSPQAVEARLIDPVSLEILLDDLDRPLRTLRWARGITSISAHAQASMIQRPECPWSVADGCLAVARRLDLRVGDEIAVAGEPVVRVDQDGMRHEFILGRARSLALGAGQCGQLPQAIDYALVSEPTF